MLSTHDKIHELVDRIEDPIVLENIFQYLSHIANKPQRDILDELSSSERLSLNEAMAEYRAGKVRSNEEILQLLRQWRTK